jgi:hypothetical protein
MHAWKAPKLEVDLGEEREREKTTKEVKTGFFFSDGSKAPERMDDVLARWRGPVTPFPADGRRDGVSESFEQLASCIHDRGSFELPPEAGKKTTTTYANDWLGQIAATSCERGTLVLGPAGGGAEHACPYRAR